MKSAAEILAEFDPAYFAKQKRPAAIPVAEAQRKLASPPTSPRAEPLVPKAPAPVPDKPAVAEKPSAVADKPALAPKPVGTKPVVAVKTYVCCCV